MSKSTSLRIGPEAQADLDHVVEMLNANSPVPLSRAAVLRYALRAARAWVASDLDQKGCPPTQAMLDRMIHRATAEEL